jgi:hypothetical protein
VTYPPGNDRVLDESDVHALFESSLPPTTFNPSYNRFEESIIDDDDVPSQTAQSNTPSDGHAPNDQTADKQIHPFVLAFQAQSSLSQHAAMRTAHAAIH